MFDVVEQDRPATRGARRPRAFRGRFDAHWQACEGSGRTLTLGTARDGARRGGALFDEIELPGGCGYEYAADERSLLRSSAMSTSARRGLAAPVAARLGTRVHDERGRRGWTLRELAARAGISASQVHWIEAGNPGSLETYAAIAAAFRLKPQFDLVDPRRAQPARPEDPVHSAMGEFEVARLRRPGIRIGLDEPYQHFQFAGRADVLAWSTDHRALLHIENRTRLPNLQEVFGSYNAKRQWLAPAVAQRAGVTSGFDSVTHVVAALWSGEVLRVLRSRTSSFEAVCPSETEAFERWWAGRDPIPGVHSCLVVLDPWATRRAPAWVGLEIALTSRPRYSGYAEAVKAGGGPPPAG